MTPQAPAISKPEEKKDGASGTGLNCKLITFWLVPLDMIRMVPGLTPGASVAPKDLKDGATSTCMFLILCIPAVA